VLCIENGILKIPIGNRQYFDIQLNKYVQQILASDSNLIVRSFTLTVNSVSIAFAKDVSERRCTMTVGIDRNLRNVTCGNFEKLVQYDLTQAIEVTEATNDVIKSLKRNDVRTRKKLASKYGRRRRNRINQLLHRVSKHIVQQAKQNNKAIFFEDIRRIRQLYQRGNGQGRQYRGMMNSWSFSEIKRQIEYKARWEGIPVIQLSVKDTRGTSTFCPQCGERLQGDRRLRRQLWCKECRRWQDRDIVAAMNLSLKGWMLFAHSKGIAGEAMKRNLEHDPIILRVDAMKLSHIGSATHYS